MISNIPKLRLSHSALGVWNTCQRRFLLQRYSGAHEDKIDIYNYDAGFGKAFESGVVSLLTSQGDIDKARVDTLIGYEPFAETPPEYKYKAKKCLETATLAIEAFNNKWDYSKYKVLADQVSFKIILNPQGDYYCGYIDALLQNIETKTLIIGECKTTAMALENPEILYRNSSQGLGYSIVLDTIAKEYFDVQHDFISLYIVAQLWRGEILPRIHILPFPKTKMQRLDWLVELQVQVNEIRNAFSLKSFRQNSDACYKFGRTCQFYGVCTAHSIYNTIIEHDETEEWDYVFDFNILADRATAL